MRETLYRSSELSATYVGGFASDTLVVTFDCFTTRLTLDRPGFGEAFFQSRRLDAVHVISRDNLWYQYQDMPALLAAVRAKTLGYRRTVTYGSSMGGYAAIRFGNAVGASTAIAVAPQYSIDLEVAPYDRRWGESRRIAFCEERRQPIVPIEAAIIFYDPHVSEDRQHVERIAQDCPVIPVRVPYAGHSTGLYLSELAMMAELVIEIVEQRFDAPSTERIVRDRRREVGQYFDNLSTRAAARGRIPLAIKLARMALDRRGDSVMYMSNLAALLLRAGESEEAESVQRRALAREPDSTALLALLVQILLARNALDEARMLSERLIGLGVPDGHHFLADALARQGDLDGAIAAERAALVIDPGHILYQQGLHKYEAALQARR